MTHPKAPAAVLAAALLLVLAGHSAGSDAPTAVDAGAAAPEEGPGGSTRTSISGSGRPPAPQDATARGRALAGALGCGACHAGAPAPDAVRAAAPSLDDTNDALPPGFVFAYLADPVRRRPEIAPARMPDFRLDEGERVALTLFLSGEPAAGSEAARARARHPDLDAAAGARMYAALGCGGCHEGPAAPPPAAGPDLSAEGARANPDWLETYLAAPAPIRPAGTPPGRGNRMPDFRLEPAEVDALAAWLATLGGDGSYDHRAPATPSAWEMRKTEAFVRDRLSCLGCHRLDGDGGIIGPPLDGAAERLRPGWVRAMLDHPADNVPGTVMPRPLLTDADRERVAAWLLAREGSWAPAPARSLAQHLPIAVPEEPAPTDGAALYGRYCASCHGADGGADGWNAPALPVAPTAHREPRAMALRPDDTLFDGIHGGGYVLDRSRRMPAFGGTLSPEQIRALVDHIRTLCDCQGPAWSRDGRGGG